MDRNLLFQYFKYMPVINLWDVSFCREIILIKIFNARYFPNFIYQFHLLYHIGKCISQYRQFSPCGDTPLLWTLAIRDKIQIPAKAIVVWLEMTPASADSRYYGFRDGSLFMRITGSDKKLPGHEKFVSRNDGLWVFQKAKWLGSEKKDL